MKRSHSSEERKWCNTKIKSPSSSCSLWIMGVRLTWSLIRLTRLTRPLRPILGVQLRKEFFEGWPFPHLCAKCFEVNLPVHPHEDAERVQDRPVFLPQLGKFLSKLVALGYQFGAALLPVLDTGF